MTILAINDGISWIFHWKNVTMILYCTIDKRKALAAYYNCDLFNCQTCIDICIIDVSHINVVLTHQKWSIHEIFFCYNWSVKIDKCIYAQYSSCQAFVNLLQNAMCVLHICSKLETKLFRFFLCVFFQRKIHQRQSRTTNTKNVSKLFSIPLEYI